MNYTEQHCVDFATKTRVQRRKAQKPKIEKIRRDRINGSLKEIKELVLEALKKDSTRYTKMEKADILEMTVQFLKCTQLGGKYLVESGIRSHAEHSYEMRSLQQTTSQVALLAQNQFLLGMKRNITILPVLSNARSIHASTAVVALATGPTFVWLPYPPSSSSPAEQEKPLTELLAKETVSTSQTRNPVPLGSTSIIPVVQPSNLFSPVWRPW